MRIKQSLGLVEIIKNRIRSILFSLIGEKKRKILLKIFLAIFLGGFIISAWIYKEDINRHVIQHIAYYLGLRAHPERIVIDIGHTDYQKLAHKREVALSRTVLLSSSKDYVPATITHNKETYKVKLRLKGDGSDHWTDERKWSLRIRVKDNKTIFGMRQFSIQHPHTRSYIVEWIFHQLLDYVGLIHLRYDFIEVIINGKNLHLYAIEEHFDKLLIENNQYREGPIVRFNDDLNWLYRAIEHKENTNQYLEAYWSGPIDVFHPNRIKRNKMLWGQYKIAKNLLESFRRGKLEVHQVFNIKKLALLFAITDLWGSQHAHEYHNIRFYYNPVTSLLEPIGYDSAVISKTTALSGSTDGYYEQKNHFTWEKSLFENEEFFREYVQALKKVSSEDFLVNFFKEIGPQYKEKMDIVYTHFNPYRDFSEEGYLAENQEFIRKALHPPRGLQAYFHKFDQKKNALLLQLGNIQFLPIEWTGVSSEKIICHPEGPAILEGKTPHQPVKYQEVVCKPENTVQWTNDMIADLKVRYKILGMDVVNEVNIYPEPLFDNNLLSNDLIRKKPNHTSFQFLNVDENAKEIFIQSGKWEIDNTLIIPEGFVVICREGTELNLSGLAQIISYSPLQFIGTEDHPIVITSKDGKGNGLVVLNAQQKSILKHVNFKNLSAPRHGGWQLSGAVTFYESPVDIKNCLFSNNRNSDDNLNIIRSEFTIDNTVFEQSFADAIDLDFAKGKISNSSFINSGMKSGNGDGIDFSGSVVELEDILIHGVRDKALSIGERSSVIAQRVKISNAHIAIASKDESDLTISNIEIVDSTTGFSLYQKKPEFGPALIIATKVTMKLVEIPYDIKNNSVLKIEGKIINSDLENVEKIN